MSSATPQAVRNQQALAQAKANKQKKLLAVLSVVFLALVGYQLPKLLGGDSQPSSASGGTPPAATGATPAVPTPPAAPLPTGLPDTDRVVVQPQSGQLLSFGLFKSKDPFVQQLGATETAPSSSEPIDTTATEPTLTGSEPSQPHNPPQLTTTEPVVPSSPVPSQVTFPSETTPTPTTPTATTPSQSPPAPTTTTPATPATAPGTVAISTNGVCEELALKATFPKGRNLFRVTAIAKDGKSARVAIVGGAYDTGTAAATIKRGQNLTLVNTADGTRYVLKLLASCDVETTPAPRTDTEPTTTTRTTTTTSTPTTTTTAPTTTEPIVEDELDSGEAEDQAGQ